MDTDGVEILHAAHRDGVADSVAHGLELYLLPAVDIALDEYLRYRRGIEPRLCGDGHLLAAVCDSASRAAERECGTDNDGIADAVGNGEGILEGAGDIGGDGRLAYLLHGQLKELSVLRLVDSLGIRAYQAHAVALEKALLVQLARECQTRLSAEPCEQAVGALLLYYPLDRLNGQRLEIYLIGECAVGHDGSGVRVDENHVCPRLLEHAARLSARIVEFRRLTDNDGSGAYHKYLFN